VEFLEHLRRKQWSALSLDDDSVRWHTTTTALNNARQSATTKHEDDIRWCWCCCATTTYDDDNAQQCTTMCNAWRRNMIATKMKKQDVDEEATHDAMRDDNAWRWHTVTSCDDERHQWLLTAAGSYYYRANESHIYQLMITILTLMICRFILMTCHPKSILPKQWRPDVSVLISHHHYHDA